MTEIHFKRPGLLTFVAVLLFVIAGFTLLFSISTFTNANWISETKFGEDLSGQLWISGVIDLVLAAGLVYAGISLLRGEKFGLYFGLTFAGLNMIKWFFLAFWFPVMAIISIAIDVFILYALSKTYYYFDDYASAGIPE